MQTENGLALLLTPQEVSEWLKISISTLWRFTVKGKPEDRLPYIKVGHNKRFRHDQLNEWLQKRST